MDELIFCLSKNGSKFGSTHAIQFIHKINEKFPCKTSSFQMDFEGQGFPYFVSLHTLPSGERSINANEIINPGIIVSRCRPLGVVILPEHNYCEYCFTPLGPKKKFRCAQCKCSYYCGSDCQKAAWRRNHAIACGWIPPSAATLDEIKDSSMLLLVVASLIRMGVYNFHSTRNTEHFDDIDAMFLSLLGHRDKQPSHLLESFEKNAKHILHFLCKKNVVSKEHSDLNSILQDFIDFQCYFRCNNFSLHNDELFTYGEVTCVGGSLFNHSCNPNCTVIYRNGEQLVRTIRVIEKGEELCHSYIDVVVGKHKRQTLLEKKYFFFCQCERCLKEDKNNVSNLSPLKPLSVTLELSKFLKAGLPITGFALFLDNSEIGEFVAFQLQNYLKSDKNAHKAKSSLHCNHPLWEEFLSSSTAAMQVHIEQELWPKATRLALFILAMYLHSYPSYHPMVSLQLLFISKLLWNALPLLEDDSDSHSLLLQFLSWTESNLSVSHSNDSYVTKDFYEFQKMVMQA